MSDEVKRDEIRVQLEQHHEAAEHDLGHDAADQSRADDGEVPARRRAEGRHGEGGDREQRHSYCHEPVDEFDDRMERRHGGQVVLVARGPVWTAET